MVRLRLRKRVWFIEATPRIGVVFSRMIVVKLSWAFG